MFSVVQLQSLKMLGRNKSILVFQSPFLWKPLFYLFSFFFLYKCLIKIRVFFLLNSFLTLSQFLLLQNGSLSSSEYKFDTIFDESSQRTTIELTIMTMLNEL